MNYSEYHSEVNAIAEALVSESMEYHDNDAEQAMDDINDSRLHETVDGHEWIIYNAYHLPILQHSSNEDYMVEAMGDDCVETLKERGLSGLHQALAYWALYADVYELLQDKMDEYVDALDAEQVEE